MKKIKLFTGLRTIDVNVPEKNIIYEVLPQKVELDISQEELINNSLDNPIDCLPLEKLLKPTDVVAIIVDDITRPTPQHKLLPHILKRVHSAGIKKNQVKIVIALGTHRKMTQEEIDKKLGVKISREYKIINNDYKAKENFIELNIQGYDIPIEIYKEVMECDYKIAVGNIVPHVVVGWSGGAKMIQPGICGEKITTYTHWKGAIESDVLDVCGDVDNNIRKEIESIVAEIGLDFIVNTVLDENKNVVGVFSGHYIKAHRKGVELAEYVWRPQIPEKADILIISAYPCFMDYWQAFKPFAFAQFGVKQGGTIIFVFDAPEKICNNSPAHAATVVECMPYSKEKMIHMVEDRQVDDVIAITNPLNHSKIINRAKTICVSDNLTEKDAATLKFEYVQSLEMALEKAFQYEGKDASIGIIYYGGETLVKS